MDKNELEATAALAYLALSEEEINRFQKQAERMLGFLCSMMEVNAEGNESSAHTLLSNNRSREDIIRDSCCDMLESAPELEDRFIVIPNVL